MTLKQEKDLKLFSVFGGLFVAVLLLSNILTAAKFIAFGKLVMPAGVIVFPISFIFGDILTEVYGYARARKIIWTGFASIVFASVAISITQVLPAAPFWQEQAAFQKLFGQVPRIVIASLSAYFLGEFCNSWVMSKMKYWDKGKRGVKQAWRFVLSTIVGEGVDTIVFMTIAFAGALSAGEMIQTIGSLYIFKAVYEIVATPFSTRFANWVKKVEGLDEIDYPEQTNYNPFAIFKSWTSS